MHNGCNDDYLDMHHQNANDLRLCVEDPLTGRDIAGGSYNMWQVWRNTPLMCTTCQGTLSSHFAVLSGSGRILRGL